MKLVIYGASDDLIEVDGDIREEFNPSGDGPSYLSVSDGTVLRISYDGLWQILQAVKGVSTYTYDPATSENGDRKDGTPAYSDRVTLNGQAFQWVVFGERFEKAK